MVCFEFLSNPIDLSDNEINVLCIENPKLFRTICNSFINDKTEEDNIVFSENFTPYKTKGNVCVISDFFNLSYSNSVMKKLYEQIEKYCTNDLQSETIQLKAHIVNYLESIIKSYDFDFEFEYDINLIDLFKMVGFKPNTETTDTLNMLLDYILILHKYAPPKCFILINLHLFFTEEELESFYKDIINNHIKLMAIENKMFFHKNMYENVIVYDDDFCEILEN